MKRSFTSFLSAAFAMSLYSGSADDMKRAGAVIDRFRSNRRRRKKGSGKGGAGVTLKRFAPTKQPPGYYAQTIPDKHLHGHARRRKMIAAAIAGGE